MAHHNLINAAEAEKSAERKQPMRNGESITVGKLPGSGTKHSEIKGKNQYISLLEIIGRISK